MVRSRLNNLYQSLRKKYGKPQGQWTLWCKRPKSIREREEIIIGSVLTQNTNWQNVEIALGKLKKENLLSLNRICRVKKASRLHPTIRSSGYFRSKALYLRNTACFFESYGGVKKAMKAPHDDFRKELLGVKGIGEETADDIMLYALDMPSFVIDEYTRRFVKKHDLTSDLSYGSLKDYFEERLPRNFKTYQDFHALIVIWGKENK